MYAQIDQLTGEPGLQPDPPSAGQSGFITVRELDGPAATRITLYDTRPGPDSYEVMFAGRGTAAAGAPTHARVLYFDAPRAPEQADAEEFAGRQRIWPTIRDMTGLAGVWVLRGPQSATVVCTLATSVPTLDAITRAVMSSELLPGEDAALLPGPDRVQTHVVTAYEMAAAEPASLAGN
jgi:hypothetical protein